MKLQKHLAYEYKGKKHYKYVIVIPEEMVNQLGWKAGQELDGLVNDNELIVKGGKGNEKEV